MSTGPDSPHNVIPDETSPVPALFAQNPALRNALREALEECVVAGIRFFHAGEDVQRISAWTRGRVGEIRYAFPALFGHGERIETSIASTLRVAVDFGFEAAEARQAIEEGREPRRGAMDGVRGATPSPDGAWLQRVVDPFYVGLAMDAEREDLEVVEADDVLTNPTDRPFKHYEVVSDEGIHRIRSGYIPDLGGTGQLYQLIVARKGREISVYRRYCGRSESEPVLGGYTLAEISFLEEAFREINAAVSAD